MPLTVTVVPRGTLPDQSGTHLHATLVARGDQPALRGPARQAFADLPADLLADAGAVHVLGGAPLQVVVGLGDRGEVTLETLRRAAGHAIARATDLRRASVSLALAGPVAGLRPERVVEALAEGAALAANARERKPTITPKPEAGAPPATCAVWLPARADQALTEQRVQVALARVEAVAVARDLGDVPANLLPPQALAERAAEAARAAGLEAEILDAPALERLGAGLLLAVGRGSVRPPALAVLRYRPRGATRHVAVVGKGITFDAGGINLKPSKGMADMVHDKAGAAAAAGIAVGAARLGLPVAVTALLACAENLPSGSASRPGDVVTGLDGATVEIVDTDAEGRLVLADTLTYATRLDDPRPVDAIVDLATLTGSIVSALGNEAIGLFANDDGLARRQLAAAEKAGETMWRMPILPGHRAQLKSERADRKQCADRWGDCAIAAAFLEMYVAKRPWLHLDIAGVAYNEGSPEWPAYHPKNGAAGAGVRAVLRLLEDGNDSLTD